MRERERFFMNVTIIIFIIFFCITVTFCINITRKFFLSYHLFFIYLLICDFFFIFIFFCYLLCIRIMCRIPGTWYETSTVNITVEKFCQHRKKKKSCQWLLKDCASHCWIIVPVTVKQSCQWLLNNRASNCWIIVPATVKQSCQTVMKNHASDCWTIVPLTVEQSCQPPLKNCENVVDNENFRDSTMKAIANTYGLIFM